MGYQDRERFRNPFSAVSWRILVMAVPSEIRSIGFEHRQSHHVVKDTFNHWVIVHDREKSSFMMSY